MWGRGEVFTGFCFRGPKVRDLWEGLGPRHRWDDNIKMDLWEIWIDGVNWIHLAQDRGRWWAFVNMVMNFRVP
jgi:hypothetical protein